MTRRSGPIHVAGALPWAASFAALLLTLDSCRPSAPDPLISTQPAATTEAAASAPVEALAQRVDELVARARLEEPAITRTLEQIADRHGAAMIKLDHRLKTRESTERKVRKLLREAPGMAVSAVTLDDSLRYTMRVDDDPPGHYLEVVRKALDELGHRGHEPVRLKNYWRRDDNYSGINAVLKAPSGLEWELQFHTSASAATQDTTHAWYEELRRVDTPVERQRQLFDMMTKAWNEVPVPRGVLEPGAVHPRAELLERPRP